MAYHPEQKVLNRYADILVNFALGGGKGIKPGEVVLVTAPESAKPLYFELLKTIQKAGGHVISRYLPDDDTVYRLRDLIEGASNQQLDFWPDKYYKGLVDTVDHRISIICESDKHALKGVDPIKIMRRSKASGPFQDLLRDKESQGKHTWTLALYGTPAMAKEAELKLEDYWQQIIHACFLDKGDPVAEWRRISKSIGSYKDKLNKLTIDSLHVKGEDVDLTIYMGDKRRWATGGGNNIPSFEIFTSPDWRGTNGWIRFNQPLYRYGTIVEGIELEFKGGIVVKAKATKNEEILTQMITNKNADKVGEFSLTDKRFSKITKFMAETLYDENVGGKYGNTHIALGKSYYDCYDGDPSKLQPKDWEKLGFNGSVVHTDMVSTTNRIVTAILKDGTSKLIYRDGQFQL